MMFWFMEGTCFLPAFLVIWASSTFIISFVIAVLRGDVRPDFPYISYTGKDPPQSGVFGLMTAITTFTSVVTMSARYKYVQNSQEVADSVKRKWNLAALVCGLISCLGMCIVGTFQVKSLTETTHDAGAILFFVFGVTYIIMQSVISYKMHPYASSKAVYRFQSIISGICLVLTIPMLVCAILTATLHLDEHHKETLDQAAAILEWMVAFGFVFFFYSYIHEFKRFKLGLTLEMLTSN
ncbi:hypothetical protein GJAV_G00270830 [Gymnothorax javanicus]|nr:hypothetical protein GJAV_G00270830 [Gymnothorax javanicus]